MDGSMEYAYPAGEESGNSDEEWDLGWPSAKRSNFVKDNSVKDLNSAVPHDEDNVSVLKRAIREGDVGTVEKLLDNGVDVETPLGYEWSPLMCAVNVANYDLAKLLLDRGATANFSKDNWTVLMANCTASASEDKIAHCMELLLSRNADPNVANRTQMTCLMLAAKEGYSKVINLLVSHGADINVQEENGYTALSTAVQHGREKAVLKLLQLGADKSIRNKFNNSPADLAVIFKHTQIARILASSANISLTQTCGSMEETLSKIFQNNSKSPSSNESVTMLDDLELLLHGLDLGYLIDIIKENDITWSSMLTMEKKDLEKFGITDPEHQQKLLNAVQQMQMDKVDLHTISLQAVDTDNEELLNFLISVHRQSSYLTEAVHDVINRFPRKASQLVFSLDPKGEAQAMCNLLEVQSKDLQNEVAYLRTLLCQMEEATDCCHLPQVGSHGNRKTGYLRGVALSLLGATSLMLLYKAACGCVYLPVHRNVC
ncbi:ankyrin repeat, SAM and basic leucine zipper domain-containing protein 1 [Solea solea]|uniref:ankyrin repeat, SAM and basic leucine zipper domain-containing protein 1 n=1 Tax=Solea solea TaxID=90069 RepID=UPI00272DB7F9|nr:ankyrin repeat, SAM and basic leucine zipper domain-containing protein 1 [Solea solea]